MDIKKSWGKKCCETETIRKPKNIKITFLYVV